jgi:hypothetical protein
MDRNPLANNRNHHKKNSLPLFMGLKNAELGEYSTLIHSNINTLASRGLEEPAHPSRGLEEPFFQLCCCVSFWFWREIGFGCTYYYVLGEPYSCGVVLFYFGKKKIQSSVWRVHDHYYNRKKSSSRLSGGCAIVITTGKKKF